MQLALCRVGAGYFIRYASEVTVHRKALIASATLAISLCGATRSVRDGVFTQEQAARGQKIYRAQCARCHGENLLGGDDATELVGEDFLARWNGKTAGDLVELTRKTMPSDGPGVLSRRQSTDVTAYILSANGFPAGQTELESDAAKQGEIRIETKQ
jgi:quinoprotein glucose dehydrogenase